MQYANLVRQQIASCFAVIRSKKSSSPHGGPKYGEQQKQTSGNHTKLLENISPGMEVSTEPGEEITSFSPDIPNPQFFEHVQLILKIVAANLGLPLHAVLLDASQTNFSGWRGAHDQARSGFKRIQKWFIRKFHRRVYLWKVRRWLEESPELQAWAAQDGVDIFAHKWHRPTWEYIEPVKDTAADLAKVGGMLSTLRRIHAKRGEDFDEIIKEAITDNAALFRMARDMARELNQEAVDDSEKITWRELLAMPLHEGLTVSLQASADSGATSQTGSTNAAA